ncbi:MAG: tyrosine-type recombinase/integrase [Bacillota bacterium]
MRGHIRKRSRDSWTVVVELPRDPETGKRRQRWVAVKGPKREAERVLAQLISEVERGAYAAAPARLSVGEYLDRWLKAVEPRLRPQTREVWGRCIRHWQDVLGSGPLVRLTAMDVQQGLNALPGRLAPSTRAHLFAVLRAALKQAVKWGFIPRSPTDGVKGPPRRGRQITVWTEEQVCLFLQAARASRYYPLFHTALATGMRLGELLGLTWQDVDLDRGAIHVRRSLVLPCRGEPHWQEPKTSHSRRKVPLDPITLDILRELRKRQSAERLKAGGYWQDYDLVFTTKRGRPVGREEVGRTLKRLALRTGVPFIRFHDLRHTHATLLLARGVHAKVVSERLGHSSVALTLDVYSHVLPDTQREAARAIEQVLTVPVSKPLAGTDQKRQESPACKGL